MTKVTFEEIVRFGAFELDLEREELRFHGEAVAIQPQPLRALALLVNHGGKLVSREQMQRALWGDSPYLDVDRSLNHTIRKLRLVLDDDARSPSLIQTVPRRGYRFIGKTESAANGVTGGRRALTATEGGAERLFRDAERILLRTSGEGPTFLAIPAFRDIADEGNWPRLAEGVVEELISALVRLHDRRLVVIDAAAGDLRPPEPSAVSRDFLLRGAVRRMGACVRVHAHLIQRFDGRVVGTAVFEERLDGLFELQLCIAERIVSALVEPLLEQAATEEAVLSEGMA